MAPEPRHGDAAGPGADRRDRGAVTAELALALPAVILVVAVLLATGSASLAQLRCVDAARTVARMVAVGHTGAEVRTTATRVAGAEVEVEVVRDGEWVDVIVRRHVAGAWFTGGPLALSARASTLDEP